MDNILNDIILPPSKLRNSKGETMGKDYKHAKERSGFVQVCGTLNGTRYRLATGKKATAANLKWVDNNWQAVILSALNEQAEEKLKISNDDLLIKNYGLKSLEANEASRRELTNREYLGIFQKRIIPFYRDKAVDDICATDLKKWQGELTKSGLSGSRVNNIRAVFYSILKDAASDGLIKENPFEKIESAKRGKPDIKPFTLDEIKHILKEADGWFKNMLSVAFFTGMRTGELLALEWSDINFVSKKISINKSVRGGITDDPKTINSFRDIDILEPVENALREQYKLTGLTNKQIFLSPRTKQGFKNANSVTDTYWHPLVKNCLLNKRDFYNTRHTFASLMVSRGEDILWVSKMLGHTNAAFTLKVYAKFVDDKKVQRASFLTQELDSIGTRFGTKLAHDIKMANFANELKVG